MKSLLKYNADTAMSTKAAIDNGRNDILKLLLDHGVEPDMWGYHQGDNVNTSALIVSADDSGIEVNLIILNFTISKNVVFLLALILLGQFVPLH